MNTATAPYFQVHPVAVGTTGTECLSSLMYRLAAAHGVTRYQFISHLRQWWLAKRGHHLPRCEELRWDGYSPNVVLGLSALKDATGVDFSSTTLIALKDVCTANFIGSIRHVRQWCPACFREDLDAAREPYDRLLWRIQGIERCSAHRHRLVDRCPACGALQSNDKSRITLHRCTTCQAPLDETRGRAAYRGQPTFGEAQIETLVARLPEIARTAPLPLHRFLSSLEIERTRLENDLGDLFHSRLHPAKPQLSSLVAVSAHFNVDIVQLITAPEDAAAQATFDFQRAMPKRRTRPLALTGRSRSQWFEKELIAVIEAGPPFPTISDFCRTHDFSLQAARASHFPLVRQLSRKRLAWIEREKARQQSKARGVLRTVWRRQHLLSEKEIVRIVAERSGAGVRMVRSLVRARYEE